MEVDRDQNGFRIVGLIYLYNYVISCISHSDSLGTMLSIQFTLNQLCRRSHFGLTRSHDQQSDLIAIDETIENCLYLRKLQHLF